MTAGVIALVLLPVMMFGLAWLLATIRAWAGVNALPHARHIVRAARSHHVAPRPDGNLAH